ncbi:MAG: autotransporter outer membrane beta-barrel domain-containing protein [Rhizobiales bacterium]|nr:autotransporter outer membrane beta-barrel domain-containing protein [Hyphomicrobiales bacterium]NRB13743.1 autotransporter outer membrane beta-barrel domain-containing protein [Hyphomicrobiales bacterium]
MVYAKAICKLIFFRTSTHILNISRVILVSAMASAFGMGLSIGIGISTAQAAPVGCTPITPVAGSSITCVAPPTPIDGIATIVDDFSINIGAAGTPTTVLNASGDGVNMSGSGAQTVNILDAASTVGGTGDGVDIRIISGTGDLTIISQGYIWADDDGIEASNSGSGGLTINVVSVTGDNDGDGLGSGIDSFNNSTGDLTITATGDVVGGFAGIAADNHGPGALRINVQSVTGDIEGDGFGIGIDAYGGPAAGDISIIAAGAVRGGLQGIRVIQFGTGDIMVDVNTVTGDTDGNGIGLGIDVDISNSASTGNVLITASGAIVAGGDGIRADNDGIGGITIQVTSVTGDASGIGNSSGIEINNYSLSTQDVVITATGIISGGFAGIAADNTGTGALKINVIDVIGDSEGNGFGIGIDAYSGGAASGDVSITAAGAVRGGLQGIRAFQSGTGGVMIDVNAVTGDADGNAVGEGIEVENLGTGITNIIARGDIEGAIGIGIRVRTNMAATTITTYGQVKGTGGIAIDFQGDGHDILNLNSGSVIVGSLDFGNGNDGLGGTNANDIDTLNIAAGFNGELTFADTGGTGQGDTDLESAPEIINVVGGSALINGGTSLVVVDSTGFAAADVFLGSVTNSVLNMIAADVAAPINGSSALGFLPTNTDDNGDYSDGAKYWLSGYGGTQLVQAAGNNANLNHVYAGLLFGAETALNNGTFGLVAGYGGSHIKVATAAGNVSVNSLIAAPYWQQDYGTHSVDLALIAGVADHQFTRNVGATQANGQANSWFVAPSATLAMPFEILNAPAVVSIRANYAGLFLNGYTETGTVANPLTVAARNVHQFNTRAQIMLPHTTANDDGSTTLFKLRAGVDAQFDLGSDMVNTSVGGTAINLNANLEAEFAGFVGASLRRNSLIDGLAYGLSGEVRATLNGGYEAVASVNMRLRF